MEKALEILRNDNVFDEEYLSWNKIDIASAIKELEEAMKLKTCKGCAYEAEDMQDLHCAFCSRACKDNFEPKDTQC